MLRLTREQSRRIDQLAVERYHLDVLVLMENAARSAAEVCDEMLAGVRGRSILIVCGSGNNGGDGLALARHLHNRGAAPRIGLMFDPARARPDGPAAANLRIVQAMSLPIAPADPGEIQHDRADLIVDAIFGTGLSRPARDPFPSIVAAIGRAGRPVLAIDVPSGMDCDTGQPLGVCVPATGTITFVAEKIGFANPQAKPFLGRVWIGDIGAPGELLEGI